MWFGYSMALSGETAIVGAISRYATTGTRAGSAYVFTRAGSWTQQAKLMAADGATLDFFGYSVAISGDTAIVGAPYDDHTGVSNAGSAYMFLRAGTTWRQQAKRVTTAAKTDDNFGYSVAISGDTAIVGVPAQDAGGKFNSGSAYVFTRVRDSWAQLYVLVAADADPGDNFGHSVAISGDTAIVGAPLDRHAGASPAGSAYVFEYVGCTAPEESLLGRLDDVNYPIARTLAGALCTNHLVLPV